MLTYDKNEIGRQLEELPHEKRVAFAAACCERLIGNYVAFMNESGWGDESPLRNAINQVWKCSLGNPITSDEIQQLTEKCESVAPDSEEFDALLTASAQDAVFAVCSAFDYLRDNDISKLVQCSSYPVDSVDLYVQEIENMAPNSTDLEERIREHRLMQQEIERQISDLSTLRSGGSVEELRDRATETSLSNLGQ